MGAIGTKPLTIEEFDKLDLPRGWELRNGELVQVTFPVVIHRDLQLRISDLFRQAFPNAHVLPEYPFQIEQTNDKRSADVGMTTMERGLASRQKGILSGAPEVVVEVLSPSNDLAQLKRDRRVYFAHGMLIFLQVDPDDNTIEVYRKNEKSVAILTLGDTLGISWLGEEKTISVNAVFQGITIPEGTEHA